MLTGVYPIYEVCMDRQAGQAIKAGKLPYIDPRWRDHSFAESELIDAIQLCWERHPEKRISAADLVRKLRVSVQKNRELLAQGLERLPDEQEEEDDKDEHDVAAAAGQASS